MYAAKNEWPTGGKRVSGALTIKAVRFRNERGFPTKFLNFRPAIRLARTELSERLSPFEIRLIIIRDKRFETSLVVKNERFESIPERNFSSFLANVLKRIFDPVLDLEKR